MSEVRRSLFLVSNPVHFNTSVEGDLIKTSSFVERDGDCSALEAHRSPMRSSSTAPRLRREGKTCSTGGETGGEAW